MSFGGGVAGAGAAAWAGTLPTAAAVAFLLAEPAAAAGVEAEVGIGPGGTGFSGAGLPVGGDAADFVLGKFDKREQAEMDVTIALAADAAVAWAVNGIETAMNQYNRTSSD